MSELTGRQKVLAIVLRCLGGLDTLAVVAAFMPRELMNVAAVALGLDPLPADPVVGYLARSASVMYALHGITILYISFDVGRYWRLIQFLAIIAIFHGAVMTGVGIAEELPLWWQLVEGPSFSATGVLVLSLQWWARN